MVAVQQLTEALKATVQPIVQPGTSHQDAIKRAEEHLERMGFEPGFAMTCLRIISSNEVPMAIRQAGAVFFKNFVSRCWVDTGDHNEQTGLKDFVIPENEKQEIRASLIQAMVPLPNLLQSQVAVAIERVVGEDFPDRWPTFVDTVLQHMRSDQNPVILAGLVAFYRLARRWQSRTPEEKAYFHKACQVYLPQALQLAQQRIPMNDADSYHMVRFIAKTYNSLILYSLSVDLMVNSNFQEWLTVFVNILDKEAPMDLLGNDREDWPTTVPWKCKKWAAEVLGRIFQKYGNPSGVTDEYKQFADHFVENYAVQILEVIIRKFYERQQKGTFISPRVTRQFIIYIRTSLQPSKTWQVCKQHLELIFFHIIFPLMSYSEEDEEMFNLDPVEYVRVKYNFIDEFFSPNRMAELFITDVVNQRPKQTLVPLMEYCNRVMTKYAEQPPNQPKSPEMLREKDGVLHIVGTVSTKLKKRKEFKNQLEGMLVHYVLPDLNASHGLVRARAIWTVAQFYDINWRSTQVLAQVIDASRQLLNDEAIAVQLEAAFAIERFVELEAARPILSPHLRMIMTRMVELIERSENDELTTAIQILVQEFDEEIVDVGVDMAMQIGKTFMQMMEEELSGNEENDKLMAAYGLLNVLSTLIYSFQKKPNLVIHLEPAIMPVITVILNHKILLVEFVEEVIALVEALIDTSKSVSDNMWRLFPAIHQLYEEGDIQQLSDIVPVLHSYICNGAQNVVAHNEFLDRVYKMCESGLKRAEDEFDEHGYFCMIIEILFQHCRGNIDQWVKLYIDLLVRMLAHQSPDKDPALMMVITVTLLCGIFYNARLAVDAMGQNVNSFFELWFKFLQENRFRTVHDRKMGILAIMELLAIPDEQIPQNLHQFWPFLMPAAIKLFDGLPEAYKEKERLMEDTDDEYDEDDEEEEEGAGVDDNEDFEANGDDGFSAAINRWAAYDTGTFDGLFEDDEYYPLAMDEMDEYILFCQLLEGMQSQRQRMYTQLMGTVDEAAKPHLQAVYRIAQQHVAEMEERKKKEAAKAAAAQQQQQQGQAGGQPFNFNFGGQQRQ